MKFGYGRNRKDREFKEMGVDDGFLFIDTAKTDRMERKDMFRVMGLCAKRGDDVSLALLAWGDLGQGADLSRQRAKLDEMGVAVTVANAKPKRPRGRPKGSADFSPSPEHDEEIKAAWHDDGRSPKGVLDIAARRGYQVTISQLKYRYGNRFS